MTILKVDDRLGRWKVVDLLGTGGNGEVWLVEGEDGRQGALKVIRDQRADKVPIARFRREVTFLQKLGSRDGVVPLLDAHIPDMIGRKERVWYVMAVASPLRRALSSSSVQDVVEAVRQLARVLTTLHAEGIAHRDIKPENLYLWQERPALGDFGLVALPDASTIGETGRIPGSFGYIADELLLDPSADGQPADVFALAKVLWVLLTRSPYPLQGSLSAEGRSGSLARELTHPRAAELDLVLAAATAQVPSRLSMAAFAADLDTWVAGPQPAPASNPVEIALQRAKLAITQTLVARDQVTAGITAVSEALDTLRARARPLVDTLQALDPSAVVGPQAIGDLRHWIEAPVFDGMTAIQATEHWGIRVERENGWARILLVAFAVQADADGQLLVDGVIFSGLRDVDQNPTALGRRSAPIGSLSAQRHLAALVEEAAARLPEALHAFAG
jgi:hypothetical protein